MFIALAALTLAPRAMASNIPFTLTEDGYITVPLEIGGVEAPCFILDTATRRFGVTNQMADRHWAERVFEGTLNHVSSGGKLRLPLAKLHRIRFGDHEIETGYAAIFPDRAEAGVISCGLVGFDAYHGYVMRLNGPEKRLELTAHSGNFARAGWRLITAEPNSQGALMIDTSYNGEQVTVMLATGLKHSMMDFATARRLMPEHFKTDPNNPRNVLVTSPHDTIASNIGLIARERTYETLMLTDFHVNGWALGDVEVAVAPLPVRDQTGYMDAPLIMLGADILKHKDFALDTRAHQLWVPPADGIQHTASQ